MNDITPHTIADRLQTLATEMLDVAAEMDQFGFFSAIGQLGKSLSITAVRVQSCVDDIREDYPTEAPATPDQPTDRAALQATGTHPAPCARHCEANAYKIEIRHISAERDALAARLAELEGQEPVAWYADIEGWGREYNGCPELSNGVIGKPLYARPVPAEPVNTRLLDVATGEVQHIYAGLCPDSGGGSSSRDPECPACRAISAAESKQGGPVRLTDEEIKAALKVIHLSSLVLRISRAIETAVLERNGFNPRTKGD